MQFIEDGHYPVGSQIPPERELAKQLNVSRASVREALIALEVKGWVRVRVGSGVTVLSRTPEQVARDRALFITEDIWPDVGPIEVVAARRLIECATIELAARVITDEELAQLDDLIIQMEQEHDKGPPHLALDRRFHLKIAEISGNGALVKVLEMLWDFRVSPLFLQFETHFVTQSLQGHTNDDHRHILAALTLRDSVKASCAMHRHLERVERAYTDQL